MSDKALTLSLARLPRALGSTLRENIVWVAPDDLGTPSMSVTPGTPIELLVDLTSVEDGVLVQVATSVDLVGECVRCLRDLDEDRSVRIDELYLFPQVIEAQRAEGDEEAEDLLAVGETTLDLEPALRDALVPTLPFQPLCRPDCPGLCADCGKRLEDLPADHHHEVLDPRWSALAGLLETETGQEGEQDAATSGEEQA